MKSFWALPVLLRVAVASRHVFSVNDDVLAYPQYEIKFTNDHISEVDALSKLDRKRIEHDSSLVASSGQSTERHGGGHNDDTGKFSYEVMVLKDQQYLCKIPELEETVMPDANDTLSKLDEEKELARANDKGWELLSEMKGNCIYFWSGWWSYSYCFGEGVRQFHQLPTRPGTPPYPPVEDPTVTGFVLGSIQGTLPDNKVEALSEEKGLSKDLAAMKATGHLETRGGNKYLVQHLGGGTICDLTEKPRRIEVQFHCNPASQERVHLIKEVATCAYLMIIHTPRLCNDVAFLPPQIDFPNIISCTPVLEPDQVSAHEARVASSAKQELASNLPDAFKSEEDQPKPTVGNIVVGAYKWIQPGKKIEKSAILGGGKETFVSTLADSKGKVMTPEELSKLGFKDHGTVERYKKRLEELAGDKPWKIDIVDTPRGTEIRGQVIEPEDEPQEKVASNSNEEEIEVSIKEDGTIEVRDQNGKLLDLTQRAEAVRKQTRGDGKKQEKDEEDVERGSEETYKEKDEL